jgi:hypothetical protein
LSGKSNPFIQNYVYSDLSGNYLGHGLAKEDFVYRRYWAEKTLDAVKFVEDGIEYIDYNFRAACNIGGPTSFVRLPKPISKTNEQILRITYTIKGSINADIFEDEMI